jgi:hypothetical protein
MGRKFQREGTGNGKELSAELQARRSLGRLFGAAFKNNFFFDEKWNFHQHRFSF